MIIPTNPLGKKSDNYIVNSVYGVLAQLRLDTHNSVFLYPELASSIQLQKAAGAWAAYPTPTEIIPASTITDYFDLHFLNISAISANGEYTIRLYQGGIGAEVLVGAFGAARNAVQSQEGSRNIITPLMDPNTRISAAISGDMAAQETLNIKVEGHTY